MRDAVAAVVVTTLALVACPLAMFVVPVWVATFWVCDLYDHLRPPRE